MKRFAVFAYDNYYPSGGMYDYQVSFDTKYEAEEYVATEKSSPRYPAWFGSPDPRYKYFQTKFGKYDEYEIEDMEGYE